MVLVNKTVADQGDVLISAIVPGSNLSSKLLEKTSLAAFALKSHGKKDTTVEELVQALISRGIRMDRGVVVVMGGAESRFEMVSVLKTPVMKIGVVGDLEFDHVLSLLSNMRPEIK